MQLLQAALWWAQVTVAAGEAVRQVLVHTGGECSSFAQAGQGCAPPDWPA